MGDPVEQNQFLQDILRQVKDDIGDALSALTGEPSSAMKERLLEEFSYLYNQVDENSPKPEEAKIGRQMLVDAIVVSQQPLHEVAEYVKESGFKTPQEARKKLAGFVTGAGGDVNCSAEVKKGLNTYEGVIGKMFKVKEDYEGLMASAEKLRTDPVALTAEQERFLERERMVERELPDIYKKLDAARNPFNGFGWGNTVKTLANVLERQEDLKKGGEIGSEVKSESYLSAVQDSARRLGVDLAEDDELKSDMAKLEKAVKMVDSHIASEERERIDERFKTEMPNIYEALSAVAAGDDRVAAGAVVHAKHSLKSALEQMEDKANNPKAVHEIGIKGLLKFAKKEANSVGVNLDDAKYSSELKELEKAAKAEENKSKSSSRTGQQGSIQNLDEAAKVAQNAFAAGDAVDVEASNAPQLAGGEQVKAIG